LRTRLNIRGRMERRRGRRNSRVRGVPFSQKSMGGGNENRMRKSGGGGGKGNTNHLTISLKQGRGTTSANHNCYRDGPLEWVKTH